MSDPKVFIFAPVLENVSAHEKLEKMGCDLIMGEANWHTPQGNNEDEMINLSKDAQALMGTSIRSSPITRNIMASNPELRIVAKCTVGTDDIDVDAATELGILVCHAPTESNCYGVAEGTVAMILSALKKVTQRNSATKDGQWRDPALMGTYLGRRDSDGHEGITLGIIGLGRIGGRVAELFAPWKMRIIAADPYIDDERFIRHGVEKVDLDTLLAESDVVTMHCVHNTETHHMMDPENFAKMKPTALFINTSRGGNVDEAALAGALASDCIAGAVIDAFENEPLPKDSPLLKMGDNVMLSAHMVSSNHSSGLGPGYEWATQSVLKALSGEVPDNVFNPEVIERWKERFAGKQALTANEPLEPIPYYGTPR
jgi:phosphoglycerate dehydrogenase-like enzyme